MYTLKKTGKCRVCQCDRKLILHKQIFKNNNENYTWVCSVCHLPNAIAGGQYISRAKVEEYLNPAQIDELPIIMPESLARCSVCGVRSAEVHHWAPKAYFGDEAEKWPKDYLCPRCHRRWHQLVTPALLKK